MTIHYIQVYEIDAGFFCLAHLLGKASEICRKQ
jgi:hypothetical protein